MELSEDYRRDLRRDLRRVIRGFVGQSRLARDPSFTLRNSIRYASGIIYEYARKYTSHILPRNYTNVDTAGFLRMYKRMCAIDSVIDGAKAVVARAEDGRECNKR